MLGEQGLGEEATQLYGAGVEGIYAGQRCQLELFCAGDRAREGMKQGHPADKMNFKQQLTQRLLLCA